jgi:nucleoside-diphosphate-sugar epimerase
MRALIFGTGFISNALNSALTNQYNAEVEIISFRDEMSNDNLVNATRMQSIETSVIIAGGITRLIRNDKSSFLENIRKISLFLDMLAMCRVKSLTFLSTIDVYGQTLTQLPLTESSQINPDDFYSLAKVACEFMVKDYAEKNNIPYLLARLTGVYGPADGNRSAISKLINSAVNDKTVSLTNAGEIYRDFLFINDLSDLICQYVASPQTLGVMNFATGNTISLLQVADYLNKKIGIKIILTKSSDKAGRAERVEIDLLKLRSWCPDVEFSPWRDGVDSCLNAIRS